MDTPDERLTQAHEAAEQRAAYLRGEPSDFGCVSQPYDWASVKPSPKAPRLNPTLVLDNTPQELADRLAGIHPVMAAALRPLTFRSLP